MNTSTVGSEPSAVTGSGDSQRPTGDGHSHPAHLADVGGSPTARLQDHELVAGIVQGDQQAFAELYGRYARRCTSVVRRVLARQEGTADVLQSVFLDVWRRAAPYDESAGPVGSWLLAITHHRAVDYVRTEEGQRRRVTRSAQLAEPMAVGVDPAETVLRAAERQRVAAALAELLPQQRRVLVLAYYGERSQSQIAALLGMPLGTVKSRTRDGLRRLREQLDVASSTDDL